MSNVCAFTPMITFIYVTHDAVDIRISVRRRINVANAGVGNEVS